MITFSCIKFGQTASGRLKVAPAWVTSMCMCIFIMNESEFLQPKLSNGASGVNNKSVRTQVLSQKVSCYGSGTAFHISDSLLLAACKISPAASTLGGWPDPEGLESLLQSGPGQTKIHRVGPQSEKPAEWDWPDRVNGGDFWSGNSRGATMSLETRTQFYLTSPSCSDKLDPRELDCRQQHGSPAHGECPLQGPVPGICWLNIKGVEGLFIPLRDRYPPWIWFGGEPAQPTPLHFSNLLKKRNRPITFSHSYQSS